jgi:hypothetical protein
MSATANVIPMQPHYKNRLVQPRDPDSPEPVALYSLIVLALVLHVPVIGDGICGQCGLEWPCPQMRLAYRLREGF